MIDVPHQEIARLYQEGWSLSKLARNYGRNKEYYKKVLSSLNVPLRLATEKLPAPSKDEIVLLYKEGWSLSDLRLRFHISFRNIKKYLEEAGITLRDQKTALQMARGRKGIPQRYNLTRPPAYFAISPHGDAFAFSNLKAFCEDHGLKSSTAHSCLTGRHRPQYGRWFFQRVGTQFTGKPSVCPVCSSSFQRDDEDPLTCSGGCEAIAQTWLNEQAFCPNYSLLYFQAKQDAIRFKEGYLATRDHLREALHDRNQVRQENRLLAEKNQYLQRLLNKRSM